MDRRHQPSDQSGQGQSTRDASPGRKVKDFDALARQRHDQSSSGTTSNGFEVVDNTLSDKNLSDKANKLNQQIERINKNNQASHEEHFAKSKEAIIATAKIALDRVPKGQPKKALIFGIGHGFDTPLEELARSFDHITIVDCDKKSSEKAIMQLPPELQPKIKLVVDDITGVTHKYAIEMKEILKSSKKLTDFEKSAKEITDRMAAETTGRPPDVGKDYAFACSNLVLSQLGRLAYTELEAAVRITFPLQLAQANNKNFWGRFWTLGPGKNLENNVQKEHIHYLARSVLPKGTVHFADTTMSVTYDGEQRKTKLTIDKNLIDSAIKESFPSGEQKITNWHFKEQPGKMEFMVASYSLSKEGPEQSGSVPPKQAEVEMPPDVPQTQAGEQDTVGGKKKKKKKKKIEQPGPVPAERSGAETPPDVSQKQARAEDTVGGKNKIEQPGSVPPERSERSGAETPPDVRQQITDILRDPLMRERLKQIIMQERSKEMKELRNENEQLQARVEQLQARVEQLPGEVAQAVGEKLTRSYEDVIGQIQARAGQLTRSPEEAAQVVENVLASSYEDVISKVQDIVKRLDDKHSR
jgi:hypothetical protein